MGLLPLEFTDGLTDSPYFRVTLQAHERELDRTNSAIKHLIKDIKDLIAAARNLSRAQRTLSETLNNFNFECIGNSQTDDEMVIANSFKDFARLLSTIEDERDRLLEKADEAFLEPIERFRRDQIGSAKEAKKKFDKETAKYCQNLERYLNLSIKKSETQLQEADANYSIEQWHFFQAMSEYVLKLQEVNERKKFEFVETVLSFMLGWLTFYHQGHEIATDFYSAKMELQMRLQRTRNNFNMTQEETKSLRHKMLNNKEKVKQKFQDSGSYDKMYTRQGYLFLMEKKAFSTSWTKHFCQYEKSAHRLSLIQYTQTMGKIISTEEINVKECIRRNSDTIDRRFCFDIVTYPEDKSSNGSSNSGHNSATTNGFTSNNASNGSFNNDNATCIVYTFQALSEEDYKLWLDAMDGRDPYPCPTTMVKSAGKQNLARLTDNSKSATSTDSNFSIHDNSYALDEEGYCFVRKCIESIDSKGLDQKGIYRIVGVTSRVRTLMDRFIENRNKSIAFRLKDGREGSPPNSNTSDEVDRLPDLNLDSDEFESKTITSALKSYLRHLFEPIMTFQLHSSFISSAKLENRALRIERIHLLVHRLPALNFKVLKILIEHLQKVSKLHEKNLMTASNLGVCFGPTLLRTAEESVAAILDIKFVNVIAELLIENYEKIFLTKPAILSASEEASSAPNMVASAGSDPTNYNFQTNCANNQQMYETSIQQRPLPHVPLPQYGITTGSLNVSQMVRSPELTNGKLFTYDRYGNYHPVNAAARSISSSQMTTDFYGSRPMIPVSGTVRRSSSQDQLYSVIPSIQRNRQLYSTSNNTPISLLHVQHSHPAYSTSYSQQPQHQQQQQSQQQVPSSPRKPLHLSTSTPSPSPSSSISTPVGFVNQHPQSTSQSHLQPIYQAPLALKNVALASTSPSNIYGQIRGSHQYLQPSISYQNLHYQSELSGAYDNGKGGHSNQASMPYNRPMTSIGILPMNSTYSAVSRLENDLTKIATSVSPVSQPSSQQQYLAPISVIPTSNNAALLQSRQFNIPSTSSASLPSTPEHSQQQSQFSYRLPQQQTSVHSPMKCSDGTPPPISSLSISDNSYDPASSSNELYPIIYPQPTAVTQQQSIYGSIGPQIHRSPNISALAPSPLSSAKVRTRYVCIGGRDGELSFQPNQIITNVRNSREPGWLEGNLNGKTGLIPLNYVEFIE